MVESVGLGLPGLSIQPGDHLCVFYRGDQERDAVLLPYLAAGLQAGDKCICVVDGCEPDAMRESLASADEATYSVDDRQLDLLSADESYLRAQRFDIDSMLAFWEAGMQEAVDEGFTFIRAAGEMTWALRDVPGVELLVPYEAELNRSLRQYPQVILCFYDMERFTNGRLLLDIVRTHPKVLLGGTVVENPWYVNPDEFLASTR